MKVVLFCGGLGTRLRAFSETIPKPLVDVGYRPILWHIMRYFAHFGHKDFILCLGHRGDMIKSYFRNYDECLSNDFVLTDGGKTVELLGSDVSDWRITFVDTGHDTTIAGRLCAVRGLLRDDETFLASYADSVTNLDLNDHVDAFTRRGAIAGLVVVRPTHSLHLVEFTPNSLVTRVFPSSDSNLWVNGGYFVMRQEVFDYIREGEELVEEPFQRLIGEGRLFAYPYQGFWDCIDTYKDKKRFDERFERGDMPWAVWNGNGRPTGRREP